MQMTSREANWDMDNDSDIKGVSEDEDGNDAEQFKSHL